MLIYEKKVEETREIFRSAKNIPTEEDLKVTYKDADGEEIDLSQAKDFRDDGKGGMIVDGVAATAWAGDTPVIPQPNPAKPEPVEDMAAAIGDVKYETLVEALAAAVDGDTIKLLKSSKGAGLMLEAANAKEVTIDFAGFTYTCNGPAVGSKGTQTQAMHLEKGSKVTLKNGTVTALPAAESNVKMLIQNYCDLTLDGMKLVGSEDCGYVISNNFGSMKVTEGTQILATDGNVAFDMWFGMNPIYDDGINVEFADNFTGKVVGIVEYGAKNTERVPEWLDKCAMVIKAGTFTGAVVPSSSNFEFADANIKVMGGTFSDASWEQFRV